MAKKDFLLEEGERLGNIDDHDELLRSKVSERRRKEIERQDEIDEKTHTAKMAKLNKETKAATADAEKVEKKSEEPPKSPFEVKGAINLGTIDYQKQQQDNLDEIKRLKQEADESARTQGQENLQLRERIHEKEMEVLQISLQTQIQALSKMIEGSASRGSFSEQYRQSIEVAELMGMVQPQAGFDAKTTIELKRIEFDNQMAFKNLTRAEKAEERRWQMELRKLDDDRDARRQDLARQADRDKMIASLPQWIGGAIGKAIVEGGGEEPGAARIPQEQHYRIEAKVGAGGEMDCPNPECGEVIGIGPTAKSAVCAKCGTKITIKRTSPGQTPVEPEEE